MRNLIFFIALLLVSCFLLHAIEFDHHHPAFFGHGIQAALHGDDRKRLMLAALMFAWVLLLAGTGWLTRDIHEVFSPAAYARKKYQKWGLFDPIRNALRIGIVHPKLCE